MQKQNVFKGLALILFLVFAVFFCQNKLTKLFALANTDNFKDAKQNNYLLNTQTEKNKASQDNLLSNNKNISNDIPQKTNVSNTFSNADGFNSDLRINRLTSYKKKLRAPSNEIKIIRQLKEHILFQNSNWKIWLNTGVVAQAEALNALAQVGNLAIVESTTNNTDLTHFDSAQPVALFDERLQKPGVLTGTIKVELYSGHKNNLISDLQNLGAIINDSFDGIDTYFIVRQNSSYNLESLYTSLKEKSYIKKIELEILNKTYERK